MADGTSSGCDATSARIALLRAGPALQCVAACGGTECARGVRAGRGPAARDPDHSSSRGTIHARVMATTGPALNGLGVTPLGSQFILDSTFNGGEFSVGRARLTSAR